MSCKRRVSQCGKDEKCAQKLVTVAEVKSKQTKNTVNWMLLIEAGSHK